MTNNKKNIDPLQHVQDLFDALPLPAITETAVYEEKMLAANDGVKLRTQFWFPKEPVPAPTIVVRNCYPQQQGLMNIRAAELNKRGFGFVVQWCRGTGGSEGEWNPNVNERPDGLSLMNHLQKDERILNIGYWGDSYLALTGWAMADAVPAKVKTMFLGVYGCDRHTSAYKDGLFRQDILTGWAMGNAGRAVNADYMESAAYRPQVEVDEALWGGKLQWYRDWITHTERTDEYWNQGFWKELLDIPGKVNFPVFVKEGWYDHHLGSALVTFDRLSAEARTHSVLQIGPWNHGYGAAVQHQTLDNLIDDSVETPVMWFDRILRKGELPAPEIRLYVVGKDQWITLPGWPETDSTEFFLNENKTLTAEPAEETTPVSFVYDPADPLMSYGAESCFVTKEAIGSLVQPEPDYRPDVRSFLSAPVAEDMELCGPIKVRLKVSSDAEDTAFTVKLMEVFEDGTTTNIRGTITTLGFRNGKTERQTYEPDSPVEINLETWPIAWNIRKGSRLRLDISSSDFPQYAVHSNFAGVWSLQKETKPAKQTIYPAGSAVILPVRK